MAVPVPIDWNRFQRLQGDVGTAFVITNLDLTKLKASATQGHIPSQLWLARSYYEGKNGLATNKLEAYKWASVAQACGADSGKWLAKELELFLAPAELAEAQRSVQVLLPKEK